MSEISMLEKQYTEKVVNLERTVEAQKSEIEFKVSATAKYLFTAVHSVIGSIILPTESRPNHKKQKDGATIEHIPSRTSQ